jgi:hypothetical protein
MRLLRWFLLNGGTLLLVSARVWAKPLTGPVAAPGPSATTVNYQGRLSDSDSMPLDGTYGMSFALYDAAADGSLIWGPEEHTAVEVSDGLFSVGLGSLTPISSTVWGSGASYLGVQVGNDAEMSPREVVGNVPTALTVPDGAITPAKAPTLLETLPHNSIVQYGEAYTTVTDDDTWTIDIEIVFPQAFADRPRVVVMPHWNHTQHPVLVIRPSECDETHCVIHVSQSPSGTWDAGQVQWIDWIAIGPKNQEQVEASK